MRTLMNLFTKINSHDVKKLMYIFLGNIQFCCNDSRFYDEILLHFGYDAEFEKLIKFESLKICMEIPLQQSVCLMIQNVLF